MAEQAVSLQIKRLDPSELAWANERYAEVDFLPSPATDFVAVVFVGDNPAALGRVTQLTATVGELGGMYVFPEFRGSGIAKQLVDYLVAECGLDTLFCLPFEKLHDLYAASGFLLHPPNDIVPEKVLSKHAWCNLHYPDRVLLMSRGSTGRPI
ncbi:MAG: GNAT family N-acetyltransferase [Rhodanobacteraceae bacterium]|nr:GNAT family N-acetyltransferase [Rhodanobacteraceae bacterium]